MTEPVDVAVIITAYRASSWLGTCLASVRAAIARLRSGTAEIRLGVDGCPVTAGWCDDAREPYWYSQENVGTYVMRNSLVALRPARAYAIFDSDDVMLPTYLSDLWPRLPQGGIIGAGRYDVDLGGQASTGTGPMRPAQWMNGVCVISHEAWERLGGYRAERYGADADLIARAQMAGVRMRDLPTPLYIRRLHDASLSRSPATNSLSTVRRQAHARMLTERSLHGWHNTPATVPLDRRVRA